MPTSIERLKLFSDKTRLRILLVLNKGELCVCQIMGVLGISQPLVSRNLAILAKSGILKERRAGKLIYYSLNDDMSRYYRELLNIVIEMAEEDEPFMSDLESLQDCRDFESREGRCDMKTYRKFIEERSKRQFKHRRRNS